MLDCAEIHYWVRGRPNEEVRILSYLLKILDIVVTSTNSLKKVSRKGEVTCVRFILVTIKNRFQA